MPLEFNHLICRWRNGGSEKRSDFLEVTVITQKRAATEQSTYLVLWSGGATDQCRRKEYMPSVTWMVKVTHARKVSESSLGLRNSVSIAIVLKLGCSNPFSEDSVSSLKAGIMHTFWSSAAEFQSFHWFPLAGMRLSWLMSCGKKGHWFVNDMYTLRESPGVAGWCFVAVRDCGS